MVPPAEDRASGNTRRTRSVNRGGIGIQVPLRSTSPSAHSIRMSVRQRGRQLPCDVWFAEQVRGVDSWSTSIALMSAP
jgi:hypothetical protein